MQLINANEMFVKRRKALGNKRNDISKEDIAEITKIYGDFKESEISQIYLIQHSAGSGKSNSIAWLAHRLTGLHDYEDNKIFQSVIIVTDRRVLDSQLQSTVYQFDHVEGVVKKVDKNSGQLRDAINDGVGIIIIDKVRHMFHKLA